MNEDEIPLDVLAKLDQIHAHVNTELDELIVATRADLENKTVEVLGGAMAKFIMTKMKKDVVSYLLAYALVRLAQQPPREKEPWTV